jgi:hypothetical protein
MIRDRSDRKENNIDRYRETVCIADGQSLDRLLVIC